MKILLLTNTPKSSSVQKLKREAENRKHTVDLIDPTDLVPYISATQSGHDGMFYKTEENDIKRLYSNKYDVVLPRFSGSTTFSYGLALLQHFAGNLSVPVASDALGLMIASNKFMSHQAFSVAKLRTIPTIFLNQPADFDFIVKKLGLPLVCKTPLGSQGSGVFILTDELSVSTTLSAFSRVNRNLLLQRFINTGQPKSDIRAYVVDGEVVAAYRRWALASDFRSNYSISHSGQKIKLTDEENAMAVDAAFAVGLPGACGVDICRDADDNEKPYLIEANGNASLSGITAVTRVNVAAKIIDYCEKIARKSKSNGTNESGTKNGLALFAAGAGFPETSRQLNNTISLTSDARGAVKFMRKY